MSLQYFFNSTSKQPTMASFQSASIVTVLLSPADASKLTGRYETLAKTKYGEVSVLRSLRNAPREDFLLQARITPKKVKPSSSDIDGLCDLFSSKVNVSPKKTPRSKGVSDKPAAKTNTVSSPVNKRRMSSRPRASAAMKGILSEGSE